MGLYFSDDDAAYLSECYTAKEAAIDMGLEFSNQHSNMLLCPSSEHNDVHFGSCKVFRDGSIYCYACKKKFSAIDIFMEAGGMSFYEALCHIAESTGQSEKYEASKVKKDTVRKPLLRRLRPEEKELLGFARGNNSHCYNNFQTYKPDDTGKIRYKRTEEGYLIYEKDTLSWNWLITEMPYQYKNMVLNKVYERLVEIKSKAREIQEILKNHEKDGSYTLYLCMIDNYKEDYKRIYNIGVEFGLLEVEKARNKEISPFVSRTA